MALSHKCSNCGHEFAIDRTTLLKTGWGRSLSAVFKFKSASQQFDDYQKVKCPMCRATEKDERILCYGFLKPKTLCWLVFTAMAIMFLAQMLTDGLS